MIKNALIAFAVFGIAGFKPGLASDDWIEAFYAASNQKDRQSIADSLDLEQYSFTELYQLLSEAPPKNTDVQTGSFTTVRENSQGEQFYYALDIPDTYDAAKQYPVVIYLHGSVSRKKPRTKKARWRMNGLLETDDFIQVFPTAWDQAKWWSDTQKENINAIISKVKATYHVDTNKIFLAGISDGATGGFYMVGTSPSQFAGYISVIGYPGVLKNKRIRTSENIYPINMRALKIIAFNTKSDPLYPASEMQGYVDGFKTIGVDIEFVVYPDGGHDMKAFVRSLPRMRDFIAANSRVSYPDQITWQYEDKSSLKRVNWLVVNELRPGSEQTQQERQIQDMLLGLKQTYKHSGLIELVKIENTVRIQNYGVHTYTLLLSPNHFDFSEAITIIENDKIIHNARVEPSKKTLIDYAVKDFDANRLYAAEINITASQ